MSKPAPHLDEQSTKLHNLSVLQRMDPAVEDVLATAVHVVLYEFDVEEMSWSRKDVEGSLFVVKRRDQPRFQFIVMNRKSAKNLVEDLLGEFEFEVQEPYLLYRNATQEVNGIWFYHTHERDTISALFTRILTAFHKQHPTPSFSTSQLELETAPGLEPSAPPASQGLIEQHLEAALHISSSPSAPPNPHPLLTDLFAHSSALPSSFPPLVPTDLTQLSGASMTTLTHHYVPPPPPCALDKQVFKVALTRLVQDEAFIDMVYEAVMKAHSS